MLNPSGGSVLNLSIPGCPVLPEYNVSDRQFWDNAAKNPNKSIRDYYEKFEHNMPLPVIANKQLMYTIEGPKVYFNILLQLIKMEQQIHADFPNFLRLVVDNIQIFERHWRKMCVDLRVGKLDRLLEVGKLDRQSFEGISIPRPRLALQLDRTFRELGFHKKVLGKDIVTRIYAQLKSEPLKPARFGRFSLSNIALSEQLRTRSPSHKYTLSRSNLESRRIRDQLGSDALGAAGGLSRVGSATSLSDQLTALKESGMSGIDDVPITRLSPIKQTRFADSSDLTLNRPSSATFAAATVGSFQSTSLSSPTRQSI